MHHVIIIKNDRKRWQKNPNDTLRIVEDCLKLKKRTKNFKRWYKIPMKFLGNQKIVKNQFNLEKLCKTSEKITKSCQKLKKKKKK